MRRETCKTCGAAIIWLPNNNSGKKAPVDADPVKFGGNIVIEDNGAGGHHYRILKKGEPTRQGSRHQSHFSTCGQAAGHRKAAKAAPKKPQPAGLFGCEPPQPAADGKRPCPFAGCEHRIGPDPIVFSCPSHWSALPKPLRDEVYAFTGQFNSREIDEAELRRRQRDVVVKACEPVTA